MAKYFTILTNIGSALHANAQIQQTTVPWTHMALGDGNGAEVNPNQAQTGLVREVHRLPITAIEQHATNPNWIVVEAVVPNSVGGWTVRETAIYGGAGAAQCIAVGNYPASYKPVLAEGAVREMVMRMIVEISSTATVNLVIDPAVAIASRGWVESQIASPAKRGMVQLATPAQVQAGVDVGLAVTPQGLSTLTSTESRAGLVQLATAAQVMAGTEVSAVVTPAVLSSRTATETRTGLAEIATQAEAESGTDDTRMMSAKKVLQLIRATAAQANELLRGVLRIGTQAEVNAGTDDTVAVTPKKLRFGFVFVGNTVVGAIRFPDWLGKFQVAWGGTSGGNSVTTFSLAFDQPPRLGAITGYLGGSEPASLLYTPGVHTVTTTGFGNWSAGVSLSYIAVGVGV